MTHKRIKPPLIAEKLLRYFYKNTQSFSLVGDLEEEYNTLWREKGFIYSQLWYWIHVFQSIPVFIRDNIIWSLSMFRNYFKIARRTLMKNKLFSFINISGLAIGMASCFLILLWVQDETSYDSFHENSNDIYRVLISAPELFNNYVAVSHLPLGPTVKEECPEVLGFTKFQLSSRYIYLDNKVFEEIGAFVDDDFFDIFSFELIKGDPVTALQDANSIILNQTLSSKLFGDKNPIGKTVEFSNSVELTVTGVVQDPPSNSHLQFEFLSPFKFMYEKQDNWENISFYHYFLIQHNSNVDEVTQKINECAGKHIGGEPPSYYLQPLTRVHLHSDNFVFDAFGNGNIEYVYIFGITGIFILFIAMINFINLTTARSSKRSLEVGLRKVAGANRSNLMIQFFGESVMLSFIAMFFAIIIITMLLPGFSSFMGKEFQFDLLTDKYLILLLSGTALLTGLLSGCVPAIVQSSYQPVNALKGLRKNSGSGRISLRKVLVVSQFALAIIIVSGTLIISNQLDYLRNKNLGYDKEQLLIVEMNRKIRQQYDMVRDELSKNPKLLSIAPIGSPPIALSGGTVLDDWEGKNTDEELHLKILSVDYNYLETFKLQMSEGRFFSKDISTDTIHSFIINEAAARAIGFESPLNKRLFSGDEAGRIIGVIKDFNFRSLHNPVEPLILYNRSSGFYNLCIRIEKEDIQGTISYLRDFWKEVSPEYPFNYSFLDDRINNLYNDEQKTGTMFNYFTFLSILISCFGLYGLSSFMAEQRTKEIGIRKVLGSSIINIIRLLFKEYAVMIVIANIFAWPITYFIMNSWLQNFAYHININIFSFFFSGMVVLVVAVLTVSYHALKAATSNPVDALRYE